MKKIYFKAIIIVLIGSCFSCTSVKKISSEPLHAGISRSFNSDYKNVLNAAKEALVEAGLQMESFSEVDNNSSIIIGRRPVNVWSYGGLVRIVVKKETEDQTIVRVVSEKNVKINVTGKSDYSNSILSNIELKLKT